MARRSPVVAAQMAVLAALLAMVALLAPRGVSAVYLDGDQANVRVNPGSYIVRLEDAPVAGYGGGVPGLAATAPTGGAKLRRGSARVAAYVNHLRVKQLNALRGAGISADILKTHYSYAFNGFVAHGLTPQQAGKLRSQPGVVSVKPDLIATKLTYNTPSFLNLTKPSSLWASAQALEDRGKPSGIMAAGKGVVIGIVDSGIWLEHPSFANLSGPARPKIVQCKVYGLGLAGGSLERLFNITENEEYTCRDKDGHGSHTAGTAAGNFHVPATTVPSFGNMSGMAPAAQIAVYKVCWHLRPDLPPGGCAQSDSMAAIDDATADGVDVINFSISGTQFDFFDSVELAFFYAARAGVFVAASAGNSGPGFYTLDHPSPWLTTVAASSHNASWKGSVTLCPPAGCSAAGKRVLEGASLNPVALPAKALIYAGNASLRGAPLASARACVDGTLDPAKVAGKVVVCDRGINFRPEKSAAVKAAGGVGMILVNIGPNSINADIHAVPSVHLDVAYRDIVLSFAVRSGSKAAISKGVLFSDPTAPTMAAFSSRGPNLATGDILKPDVTAPGVDVYAAYTGGGEDLLSGTSMSSPHVAGIAALLKQLRPTWSPMMIKSALITTAKPAVGGADPSAPGAFAYGGGHITPNLAVNPGLVFDSDWTDWVRTMCAAGQLGGPTCETFCAAPLAHPLSCDYASDLNAASIAVEQLLSQRVITRTATSVYRANVTYWATIATPLKNCSTTVKPATFTIAPGAKQTFTVTIKCNSNAAMDTWQEGAVVLRSNAGHNVRMPVVVQPVPVSVPPSVDVPGGASSVAYGVDFGYAGAFKASPRGLVASKVFTGTSGTPGFDLNSTITVPAGTARLVVATFDADLRGSNLTGVDIDLFLYSPDGEQAGSSGSPTANERIVITAPAAGTWRIVSNLFDTRARVTWEVHAFTLPATAAGNMKVTAPSTAASGASGIITLDVSGLSASKRYYGEVLYSGRVPIAAVTGVNVLKI